MHFVLIHRCCVIPQDMFCNIQSALEVGLDAANMLRVSNPQSRRQQGEQDRLSVHEFQVMTHESITKNLY